MRKLFYYKMRQKFITKCVSFYITKCDSYYKLRRFYYKMRQLSQNATFITYCDSTGIFAKMVEDLTIFAFFFLSGFSIRDTNNSQDSIGREGKSLFLTTTSTRSQTLGQLLTTLHVRCLPCIFNRITCGNYQSPTRWDLPLRINVSLISIDDCSSRFYYS